MSLKSPGYPHFSKQLYNMGQEWYLAKERLKPSYESMKRWSELLKQWSESDIPLLSRKTLTSRKYLNHIQS
jgi:hypothetical protein